MNPKNHTIFAKLLNVGVKKNAQKDRTEVNVIQVHPDKISAVWVLFPGDETMPEAVTCNANGTISDVPRFTAENFTRLMNASVDNGSTVRVNRKRLIDLLDGLTSDSVTLDVRTDDLMLITGGYNREQGVTVRAVLCPLIDSE